MRRPVTVEMAGWTARKKLEKNAANTTGLARSKCIARGGRLATKDEHNSIGGTKEARAKHLKPVRQLQQQRSDRQLHMAMVSSRTLATLMSRHVTPQALKRLLALIRVTCFKQY